MIIPVHQEAPAQMQWRHRALLLLRVTHHPQRAPLAMQRVPPRVTHQGWWIWPKEPWHPPPSTSTWTASSSRSIRGPPCAVVAATSPTTTPTTMAAASHHQQHRRGRPCVRWWHSRSHWYQAEAGLGQVAITSGHMDQVLVLASSWIRGKQTHSSVFVRESFHEYVMYKGILLSANNEITIKMLGRCVILIFWVLFAPWPRALLVLNYAFQSCKSVTFRGKTGVVNEIWICLLDNQLWSAW